MLEVYNFNKLILSVYLWRAYCEPNKKNIMFAITAT